MTPRDWRNADDYADLAALDPSALAWEFLRRNPEYQRQWRGRELTAEEPRPREISARWGLRFPVSPDLSAAEAALFWNADAAPAYVVRLAPSAGDGATGAQLAAQSVARRADPLGLHLRLAGGLQAILPAELAPDAPLAAETPLDGDLALRLSALNALERRLRGRGPAADTLPPLLRRRLTLALQAHDARGDGASYRDVAVHVLRGPPVDPHAWRTSSLRDVAIRLCRTARRLVGGGYRSLLRRR